MEWVRSTTDSKGVKTIYPPPPKEYKDYLKCSFCGGITQFLHFFPEVLKYLKDDEYVPSFCSGACAGQFILNKLSEGSNNAKEAISVQLNDDEETS
jgi:hypothetical protein